MYEGTKRDRRPRRGLMGTGPGSWFVAIVQSKFSLVKRPLYTVWLYRIQEMW